jgi:phosphoribosylanthranilate isomerase
MNAPRIKICGITGPQALDACLAARVDHVGFVFFPPSPRNVPPSLAAELAARVGTRAGKVGLFVDADDLEIAEGVRAGRLDTIQLHGSESPERTAQVKARFGLPVWKALPVASAYDVERALEYRQAADLILFDAKTPKGALPGGMGLVFDWSLLAGYRGATDWALAGGLNADNVGEALRITGAPLVDTSSGVESAPGVKDPNRIAAFCAAVRSLQT